jgi:hypothetical protein
MSKNLKTNNTKTLTTAAQVFVLGAYAKCLLACAVDKAIEFAQNPNPGFENKNAARDLYFANQLVTAKGDVKEATGAIVAAMRARRLTNVAILSTVDAFHYAILKQAVFPAYVDQMQLLALLAGKVPDSFFESMLPNESFEDTRDDEDAARRAQFPIDEREETASSPPGQGSDYATLFSGYEVQIGAADEEIDGRSQLVSIHGERAFGTKEIAEGLEDVRIYLENIRTSYGKMDQRMAFFTEADGKGGWIRHDGSVHSALADFALRQGEKQAQRQRAQAAFFAGENAKMAAAA